MKKILFSLTVLFSVFSFAQDKRSYSLAELDFIIPRSNKVIYSYEGGEVLLTERPLYGLNYSYNYNLFRKFSVGAVTGISYLSNPKFTTAKLGGRFAFTFIEEYKANVFLQITTQIPLQNNIGFDMGDIRLGVNFPIVRADDYTVHLGVFATLIDYRITKSLFYDEKPDILEYRGTGINLAIRF